MASQSFGGSGRRRKAENEKNEKRGLAGRAGRKTSNSEHSALRKPNTTGFFHVAVFCRPFSPVVIPLFILPP